MITCRRRTIELLVTGLLTAMPVTLLQWIYAAQVPESAAADINARIYPDALAYVWLALGVLAMAEAWLRDKGELVAIPVETLRHSGLICLIVLAGFAVLTQIGYLAGSAFYILAFAWLLKERGPVAWVLAVIVPGAVYLLLLHAFEVRLPSLLDLLTG